jgi:hypothetical protein
MIDCHEIPESRSLTINPPSLTTNWVCEGIFDSTDVAAYALSITPPIAVHPTGLLYRQDIQIKEKGHRLYEWTVPYAPQKRESASYRIEFDSLGGTVHITAGTFVAKFPAGAPNHGGMIGVKGNDVEGTDIVVPAMKVIVHFKHPPGIMTFARVRMLSRLCGTVDTAGFFGWSPGETLFLGAQGSCEVDDQGIDQEISYHFAMSENLIGASIGGITGISKVGWDVAWIGYKAATDAGKAVQTPDFVQVVRVYKTGPLAAYLGFGA